MKDLKDISTADLYACMEFCRGKSLQYNEMFFKEDSSDTIKRKNENQKISDEYMRKFISISGELDSRIAKIFEE